MAEIPARSNFFSSLSTPMSCRQVSQLYEKNGWSVRKCSLSDYEISSDWAELVLESKSPLLLHGTVADLQDRIEELLAPLRAADIPFTAEYYGPPPERKLLAEWRS
jgi:hypothetical protein